MIHAVPTVPPRPALEAMSIAERMCEVMRRNRLQGQPTTRDDFRQAEETHDLTDDQLDAHIGPAKRLMHPELVRHDHPLPPLHPWDLDPTYRADRADRAAGIVARAAAPALAAAGYGPTELSALRSDIVAAFARTLADSLARH